MWAFSQPLTIQTPAANPELRYNTAPTQPGWVIAQDNDNALTTRAMRWGLIPFWAKDAKDAKDAKAGFSTFAVSI